MIDVKGTTDNNNGEITDDSSEGVTDDTNTEEYGDIQGKIWFHFHL